MKKKLLFGAIIGGFLAFGGIAFATSILDSYQGGTGFGYPGNVLPGAILFGNYGNATLATSTNFTFATSTNTLTTVEASTTNLSVSSLISGDCIQAGTGGLLTNASGACGSGGGTFPFTAQTYGVSTSTIVGFTNGLLATASSTIGNGTQAGGLTINGGATTTFPLYVHATSATNNSFVDVATLDAGTSGATNGFGPSLLFSDLPSNWTTNMARIAAVYDNGGSGTNYYSDLTFSTSPYYTLGNTTLAEAMRILYNGNVGIGTTNPGSKLEVQGLASAQYFNATSTTSYSTFSGGLLSLASSTIGNGTQAGGLTISGGATTTGKLILSALTSTQCLHEIGGVVSGTGSDCGSGGGGGANVISTTTGISVSQVAFFNSATPTILTGESTSSITYNNGLTSGGTAGYQLGGSSQTVGLASIAAGDVLGFMGTGTGVPTALATSSLFNFGTGLTSNSNTVSLTVPVTVANGGTGLTSTSQNFAFIGPTSGSGAPTWRALVAGDIPALSYDTFGYPFVPGLLGSDITAATTTTLYPSGGLLTGTSTIGSLVATSSVTNLSVKSALVLNGAGGLEGAYGGSSDPCSANQAPTTLSALGALGGCTSTFLTGNQTITLTGAVTGSGATSIATTFGNAGAGTVLDNPTGSTGTPSFNATSTLFGTGTAGQMLAWLNGVPSWVGTTTAGTGLTYNGGSPGNFSVNSSQSIGTLSNLTTNGFVTTSAGVGTLGVQTFPISVAEGGTGAGTLTGCLTGNGAGAITGSGTCNTSNASVSSIATNNGITGGTITTTGTIGLATINAGVLGAQANSSVPTSQATSTLYGAASTGGYVLQWSNLTNGLVLAATSTSSGGSAFPFSALTDFGTTTSATSTPIWDKAGGLYASTTQLQTPPVLDVGSSTTDYLTVTSLGNVGIGTSSPFSAFAVGSGDVNFSNAGDNTSFNINNTTLGTTTFQVATQNTNGTLFQVATSTGVSFFAINASSSYVGISSSSPSAQLSVSAASSTIAAMFSGIINNVVYMYDELDIYGHEIFNGPLPSLSSCGTSPSIVGNDNAMMVTVGSVSATGCTITFAHPWPNAPICSIDNQSMSVTNALTFTISTTQIVVSQTGLTGDVLDVMCRGWQ